jgi:polysaccharide pyruvyl transferase WcaK-like protein
MLRGAAVVLTRDRNCEQLVLDLSGKLPRYCPDVAFTLQPMTPRRISFAPKGLNLDERLLIGVNVSGLLYMGGYTGGNMFGLRSKSRELIDGLVDRLLTTTASKVLLIPHTFGAECEEEACSTILQSATTRHPGRLFMLTTPLSEREIKWLIGRTSFFIGSRMHACIAALSQGVPAVALAYSDKFLGVFESAGMGDSVVDLRQAEMSQVIDRVSWTFQQRETLAASLHNRVPVIQEEVVSVFRDLLSQLPSS